MLARLGEVRVEGAVTFSSLLDPVEVARAGGALDAAWSRVKDARGQAGTACDERERQRLAGIVSSLAKVSLDEGELEERALKKFEEGGGG